MSGRTVFLFVLSGFLAVVLANTTFAQFEPWVPLPTLNEIAPMPREKTAAETRIEDYVIPTSGILVHPPVLPPPPYCAFDRHMTPIQVTSGTIQACPTGRCGNSDQGLSGNVTMNERNFDLFYSPTVHKNPYPVLGITTFRWDESGGGWWVETVRVPQVQKLPMQADLSPHMELRLPAPTPNVTVAWDTDAPPTTSSNDHACCSAGHGSTSTPAPCCAQAGKFAGMWVKEMEGFRVVAAVSGDELKIHFSQNIQGTTLIITMTADCTLTREGLVHGVITGADAELRTDPSVIDSTRIGVAPVHCHIESRMPHILMSVQSLVECPFSFRTRLTSAGMMVSNMKVAVPDDEMKEVLPLICGMYKFSKDGNLPPLKPRRTPIGQTWNGSTSEVVVHVQEARTGRCMLSGSVNTDLGLSGNVISNERCIDTHRVPNNALPTIGYPYNSPTTGYTYNSPPIYATPTTPPAVARPMLPPTPPALPPPMQCPQKCEPNITCPPLGSTSLPSQEDRKQLFSFSMGLFGLSADVQDNSSVPPVPAPVKPQACPVIPPQPCLVQPKPGDIQGLEYDLIAYAFGQLLTAGQTHPVVIAPPHGVLPSPAQAVYGMQPIGGILPPPTVSWDPVSASKGLVGTWVRVVGPTVYVIRIAPDHMTITSMSATEISDDKVVTESAILTVDYHLMRDGTTAIGLITCFDARIDGDLPGDADYDGIVGELNKLQKALADKPFAMTIRVYGDALVIGNVRLPETEATETWAPMTVLGGRYTAVGDKCLPKPKVMKAPPPPPPAFTPAYPAGDLGMPVMFPGVQPNLPPGACCPPWRFPQCYPGGMGMNPFAPNYLNPMTMYPMTMYPYPFSAPVGMGALSGCGGMMPPQSAMQPTFIPPPYPIPAMDSPVSSPLPPIEMPPPRSVMPQYQPLSEERNQSSTPVVPIRIERSK
jgi:hypothetical protein